MNDLNGASQNKKTLEEKKQENEYISQELELSGSDISFSELLEREKKAQEEEDKTKETKKQKKKKKKTKT